jgi:hypothetical protein
VGIHKTPPSSKFKAVAAALIGNKNRIKTPGQPPDIPPPSKQLQLWKTTTKKTTKYEHKISFSDYCLVYFFLLQEGFPQIYVIQRQWHQRQSRGNFFADDEEKKKTEVQTSMKNLTLHLYVRFCSQI